MFAFFKATKKLSFKLSYLLRNLQLLAQIHIQKKFDNCMERRVPLFSNLEGSYLKTYSNGDFVNFKRNYTENCSQKSAENSFLLFQH